MALKIPIVWPMLLLVVVLAFVLYSLYAAVKPDPDDALPVWRGTDVDPGMYTFRAGVLYDDPLHLVGEKLPLKSDGSSDHTWHVRLEAGVRVNSIEFGGADGIDLGEAGVGAILAIRGSDSTGGNIQTTELRIDGGRFPYFVLSNNEFFHVQIETGDVAGKTLAGLTSASVDDISVGSQRGAANVGAFGTTVDKIIIEIIGSGDVQVGEMAFNNLRGGYGGYVDIQDVRAGTFVLTGGVQVGTGDQTKCSFCYNTTNKHWTIYEQAGFTDDKPVNVR